MNKHMKKKKDRMCVVHLRPWTTKHTTERRVRKALDRVPFREIRSELMGSACAGTDHHVEQLINVTPAITFIDVQVAIKDTTRGE